LASYSSTSRPTRLGFWKAVPKSSKFYFYAGVFSFFASIGFITLLMETVQLAPLRIFLTVLIMGGFAIFYAAVSIARKYWLIAVVGVIEGLLFGVVKGYFRAEPRLIESGSALEHQLMIAGIGAIVFVVAGYVLFIAFFSQQGARYFRAQNEIAMAAEI